MSIERNFNVSLIAAMALKEKQIQQNYRPIIAVHKWFARRPGSLFRGLILSEFGDSPLGDNFFSAHDFPNKTVADPFMGGGTPLVEANRVGCDVIGYDINPMAAWIVREEIEHLDIVAYQAAARTLIRALEQEVRDAYLTDCPIYGDKDVPVKYFLWVKLLDCEKCAREFDLFPGYLVAEDRRHPKNVLVCAECGALCEVTHLDQPGTCHMCATPLRLDGPAKRNRAACSHCGHENSYPRGQVGPLRHRLFAIEYFNPNRKATHAGRFFKKPDARDLARVATATHRWRATHAKFVPEHEILPGDETDRLHRWGYRRYRELFNERQLLGLELSCRLIADVPDKRVRHALATNLSDLLRYQNMLCRYDSMALKSLDIFSIHGFPVGLIQCESNLLGITNGNGANVGSGGWSNIIEKYTKAKRYCDAPFETRTVGTRRVTVSVPGEWIGERRNGGRRRSVAIRCASATTSKLQRASLDAVFTDPPYFGNVQYGELMDFCYVWLRNLVGKEAEGFDRTSTRSADELTGNVTAERDLAHFAEGLATVYRNMAQALKPGAPLAFTFHHNKVDAYWTIGSAVLDANLTCTATLPCPGEMGGSIHIHGTGSSIIDTVFVCRATGSVPAHPELNSTVQLRDVVERDLIHLRAAGVKPSPGDIRCIVYGHLARVAICDLHSTWNSAQPTAEKLMRVASAMGRLGTPQELATLISATTMVAHAPMQDAVDLPLAF